MKIMRITICFLLLATLLYAGYDVLNCSQWTRVIGTNGFQTTLTSHLTNPVYALKSTLQPPPPIGRELAAYVMLKYKTGVSNIKYDPALTEIACPRTDTGYWIPESSIFINTNYVSVLASTTFNLPKTSGNQSCYGFSLTPVSTRDWRKFTVIVQSYTKWNEGTIALPELYYGEITTPMDEQMPIFKPEDTSSPLRFTFGTESAITGDDYALSAIYIFYEEL